MATTRKKFVDKCDVIVQAKPKYELGCSSTKECDCIGMVKYGLHKNDVAFTTSGTNWTFRNQVEDIRTIKSAKDLKFGDVVFKMRTPSESGYNLPSRYKPGGNAFNGDLNDYCHIGVVKSVSPLKIIHMTSPTAKTDTSIGKWKRAACLKKQYISDSEEATGPVTIEPVPDKTQETATVYAESGRWVKMRKEPSTKCRIYDDVPIGATVKIDAFGYDWTKISYGSRKGWYMMTKFLIVG
jgi:hypothetical protein